MASLFDLPVIYVIENNGYSMGTSLERSSAFRGCLAERAEGFAIDWDTCNGEDIYEVRAKTQIAIERAHKQSQPDGPRDRHLPLLRPLASPTRSTRAYRAEEEIERYKQNHDPHPALQARGSSQEGVLTDEQYEELERRRAQGGGRQRALRRGKPHARPRRRSSRTFISRWIARPKPAAPAATSSTTSSYGTMPEITYREALRQAFAEEIERDPNVVLIGEEVAEYDGAYKVTEGLWKKYGDKRVVDTPISEAAFIGMGIGASMLGLRPVMELMFWSFASVAWDQIVNNAGSSAT